MVTGCYKGLSRDTLVGMRTDTLAELTKARQGKRIASVSMSGKSTSKDSMSIDDLKDELKEIDYALRSLDASDLQTGDVTGKAIRRFSPDFRNA
tara:strand:+ start:984 stop:1265 length:282 start_codon:yes stop_codon:yes gene_type:complete